MHDEQLSELRNRAITMYRLLMQNETTAPAAFGVSCRIIQDEAKCNLLASIMLLSYWIEQDSKKH